MADWPTTNAAMNAILLETFGEPVVYQSVQLGAASADPLTINAIRHAREREEAGALANVEQISINPTDLPNLPQRGDWVSAWGSQFVVTTVRQPDPYGMVEVSLMVRAGQTSSD